MPRVKAPIPAICPPEFGRPGLTSRDAPLFEQRHDVALNLQFCEISPVPYDPDRNGSRYVPHEASRLAIGTGRQHRRCDHEEGIAGAYRIDGPIAKGRDFDD